MKSLFLTLISIILVCAGCSRMTEDELWQKAEQSRNSGNVDSTIQMCQMILKEYPNGQKAGPALFTLGDAYQNGKQEYRLAVGYYKEFVQKYPDLNSTPLAMFVIGFIYNNHLQMSDSAKTAYQEFIARFPNHELASSAEFELKNLGKTPDEIIPPSKEVAVKPSKSKSSKKK